VACGERVRRLNPRVEFQKLERGSTYKAKYPLFILDYKDLSEADYREFGDHLLKWVEYTSDFNIEDFAYNWLLSPSELKNLAQKSPYLNECYKIALAKLLSRRVDKVIEKKLPANIFSLTLHQYSPAFEEFMLNKKNNDSYKNFTLPPIPISDLVPEKKEITQKEEMSE